ncbi:MAG: HlyD family efflux transporter periplasmic adaptor subunit [Dethiobacteria bacterium]|jgi:putative membrane fusion protein
MRKRRTKPAYLKVIEGRKKTVSAEVDEKNAASRPVYLVLVLLASLLIAQILIGWAWRAASRSTVSTLPTFRSTVDVSFSVPGTITFDEKVLLAPCSGYIYYKIAEGQRVPLNKTLARITAVPLEKGEQAPAEKAETSEPIQRFKSWFLGEKEEEGEAASLLPIDVNEANIVAPCPGVVSLRLDGLEEFGPQGKFPYFSEEELQAGVCESRITSPGEKVHRFEPLFKIIDNYYWYFSVVLPPELGRLVAGKTEVKLYFSFAPTTPVWGRKVELTENGKNGSLKITWCIGRELPDVFNRRLCEAEIVYKDLQGVLVPKSALQEIDGKPGVYILEKGTIVFKEVDMLLERENDVLIKNLEEQQRVVSQPAEVKEGQRLNW